MKRPLLLTLSLFLLLGTGCQTLRDYSFPVLKFGGRVVTRMAVRALATELAESNPALGREILATLEDRPVTWEWAPTAWSSKQASTSVSMAATSQDVLEGLETPSTTALSEEESQTKQQLHDDLQTLLRRTPEATHGEVLGDLQTALHATLESAGRGYGRK